MVGSLFRFYMLLNPTWKEVELESHGLQEEFASEA